MEHLNYYEENVPQQTRIYGRLHQALLLFALLLGLLLDRILFRPSATLNAFGMRWGIFWCIYLICFYIATWKQSARRADAWCVCAAALLLTVRYFCYADEALNLLNILMLPLLLMLHMVLAAAPDEMRNDGRLFALYLRGFFFAPFSRIGAFFGAFASLFSAAANKKRTVKAVLLGFAIGLPLMLFVIVLLANADSVIAAYCSRLLQGFQFLTILQHAFFVAIFTLFFYSFLYNASSETPAIRKIPDQKRLPDVSAYIILSMLLLAYTAFIILQFAYLTGLHGLPRELTYAQYAISGFQELTVLAGLNFLVFGCTLRFVEAQKPLRAFLGALLIATSVILYSGIKRLCMYIGAYGLTVARMISFWFIILYCFVLFICALRLFLPRLRTFRLLLIVAVIWYMALNLLNLTAITEQDALQRQEKSVSAVFTAETLF